MVSLTPLIAAALATAPAAPAAAAPAAPPAPAAPAAPAPNMRHAPAEAALPLQAGEGRAVATKLADELIANFVLPAQATRYAAMLRANAAAVAIRWGNARQPRGADVRRSDGGA